MMKRFVVLALLVTAVAAVSSGIAQARSSHKLTESAQTAVISTGNGFPDPGGTQLAVSAIKVKPLGGGASVEKYTITGHPSASTYEFKLAETLFFTHGSVKSTATGTATVNSDGSTTSTGSGRYKGGTGRYRGASDKFTFNGNTPAGSDVGSVQITGTISY